MSSPQDIAATNDLSVVTKHDLVSYLEKGCKPPATWRIGTEHEKLAYRLEDYKPLPYAGARSVRAVLERLQRYNWRPVFEGDNPVALIDAVGCSVTLEPGGQLELSGAPLTNIHETCGEIGRHLHQVKEIGAELNIGFLGIGYQPKWPLSNIPWMPKERYNIMRRYMPQKGKLGYHMMQSTCTVQVNLDFDSEYTMVQMFRIGLALQPIATSLFANSPFKNGHPTNFLSYRSHIWTDTDDDRCGTASFVFDKGFGFEQYVDMMLDVPMYFVQRDNKYIDVSGESFRDFMVGRLSNLPGVFPTLYDWENHLTTAFWEVRLKRYLEMRGADGGPWSRLCALPAFWVGLLYDASSRDAAWDLIKDWTEQEREEMRSLVPQKALKTPFRNISVREIALEALRISHHGLLRRQQQDSVGRDETTFLAPLFQIAESNFTPAEDLLCAYNRRWDRSVDPVFREYAY